MSRIKGLLFLFVISLGTCVAKIAIGETDSSHSKLVEAAVKILRSCYGYRVTPAGLAGDAAGPISQAVSSQDLSSVVSIDTASRILDNGPSDPMDPYKLQVFVVSASRSSNLLKILKLIKASKWWNHMAPFLIIDWSSSDCSDTFEMLWTVWDMNVLNAKLMCDHRTLGLLIYTFNPYTSKAPDPWRYVRTYNGVKNHPWTLFVRRYEDDDEICEELDYEKTKDLGGYEIRVSVGDSVHRRRTKFEGQCFDPIASDTCSAVFPASNATLKLITHGFPDSLGHVDDEGIAYGIMGDVAAGRSDVGFNSRALTDLANLTASYPHHQSELYAVTQRSGYRSQLSKISAVIDGDSRIGLIIVIVMTILFFKCFVSTSLTIAFLDTLRIALSSSVPDTPRKTPARIYLGCLLIFAVTMNGIFQGRLGSLLTTPQPIRTVDNMNDLVNYDYKIYGFPGYDVYFSRPDIHDKFHQIRGDICTRYVLADPKAVCVGQTRVIVDEAAKYNLHLSRKILAATHVVLPIRPDWPLEKRLNDLLMRSQWSGLRKQLNNRALYRSRLQIKLQEAEYRDEGVKVLTLDQLSFAFVVLGIGLSLASICFAVEVTLGWIQSRNISR